MQTLGQIVPNVRTEEPGRDVEKNVRTKLNWMIEKLVKSAKAASNADDHSISDDTVTSQESSTVDSSRIESEDVNESPSSVDDEQTQSESSSSLEK